MQYLIAKEQPTSCARFGSLVTPEGLFELPSGAPSVRTAVDVAAVESNIANGMPLRILTPHASYGVALGAQVIRLTRPTQKLISIPAPKPLVIADAEPEAMSFHTIAQDTYKRTKPYPTESAVKLLSTGLGGDNPVHQTWRQVLQSNGPAPIAEWMMHRMTAVQSDVLTIGTPIIRLDPSSVDLTFAVAHDLVREARAQGQATFTKFGVALVVHSEILRGPASAQIRDLIFRHVQSWARDPRMGDLFLSLKVYDPGPLLNSSETGSSTRQALGSLIRQLSKAIRLSGGVLIVQNAATWMLGYLHSGADVATFRVTGPRKIDVPGHGGKRGPVEAPYLLAPRALIEVPPDEVQRTFESKGAYPKPDCLTCEQYWRFPSITDQRLFCARQRTGVLMELSDHYRTAGLDPDLPLDEAVDSLVSEARIRQELVDLFPSTVPIE